MIVSERSQYFLGGAPVHPPLIEFSVSWETGPGRARLCPRFTELVLLLLVPATASATRRAG